MERDQDAMTTYRRADGELIGGEFTFVSELEWFDDEDRTELVKEVWQLVARESITVGRPGLCQACQGQGVDHHRLTVMGSVAKWPSGEWNQDDQPALQWYEGDACDACGGTGEEQ